MTNAKWKAVLYCRCSTEEESQRNALMKQVQEARECCLQNNWDLVGEYVESKSGASVSGRSVYQKLFQNPEKMNLTLW